MVDNGYLLYFRWLELLAEPWKDSGQIRPVVLNNRHRHLQIWPRSWLDKQNFSTNLYNLRWATSTSNPEAEMNPCRPVTKTFSVPSLPYSIRQTSLWMRTLGFEPSSPSLPYYLLHVQPKTRRFLQPSNSVAQLAYGGIIFTPCSLPIMLSPRMSSGSLEGLIERKLNEFLNLTQGTRTVMQYAQVFNHLCQYAGYHADSDARKRDRFRRGLNTKLKERLNLVRADNFNELVNMAITQEDCISIHRAEKKWKAPTGPATTQPSRYRLVPSNAPRAPPRGNSPGRWVARPPQQARFNRPPTPKTSQQPQQGPRPSFLPANQGNSNYRCFNCGSPSHFIKDCPQPRKSFQGQASSPINKGKGKR
jgi:hypothetical protein